MTQQHPYGSDTELITRLRAGDEKAFEALFRGEYETLRDFAWALCGSLQLAEEIVADVFVWLFENRENVNPQSSLAAYLMGAVRHRAANVRRTEDRASARHLMLGAEEHESVMPAPSPTPEETFLRREATERRAKELASLLSTLSQPARSVLLLRVQREMKYEEIAEALGISAGAARTQFSRAIALLQREAKPPDEEP